MLPELFSLAMNVDYEASGARISRKYARRSPITTTNTSMNWSGTIGEPLIPECALPTHDLFQELTTSLHVVIYDVDSATELEFYGKAKIMTISPLCARYEGVHEVNFDMELVFLEDLFFIPLTRRSSFLRRGK